MLLHFRRHKNKTAPLCWLGQECRISSSENSIHENWFRPVLVPGLRAKGMCRGPETWLHPDPASSLYSSLKTHLHFLKSEFVSTGLTHFPVEIFLFVQNLLRAVVMLMETGIFLKHTAPYCPPQLWKPDEDWEQCNHVKNWSLGLFIHLKVHKISLFHENFKIENIFDYYLSLQVSFSSGKIF